MVPGSNWYSVAVTAIGLVAGTVTVLPPPPLPPAPQPARAQAQPRKKVRVLCMRAPIICAAVRRPFPVLACSLVALAAIVSGCNSGTKLAPSSSDAALHHGAQLFH